MKPSVKLTFSGICLGVGAIALIAPSIASGNARTTVGTDKAQAAVDQPFLANLFGTNEVPTPGDPDGTGAASVTIDPTTGEICVDLRVANIDPATMAHIHRGAAGVSGPVVVPLTPPNPNATECVMALPALAAEIAANPAGFYVNVHNPAFPAGAVRGNLARTASTTGNLQLLNEPVRVYDSRNAGGNIMQGNTTRTISLASGLNPGGQNVIAVPPGATGAMIRVTVTDTTGPGFLKVYSNALPIPPQTSNVNWYEPGAITGADVTVAVDASGSIKITSGGNDTHVVVDVSGYIF
ncbi:MAG: CHRD domain-containing protein [Ilumatobacteraceae bacterium]